LAQEVTFGYNPNVKPYPYDPAKAKQLLAEAGYASGFKTKMETATVLAEIQPMALLVQQNLKDVGIEVEIATLETAVWRDKFYNLQPRAPIYFIPLNNSPFWDADASLNWFWSKNTSNRHYNNPAFDAAYEASRVEIDVNKRRDALQRAIAVMSEDPPFLWMVSSAGASAFNPKKLKGFVPGAVEEPRYDLLEKIG
jgi:peptide/nickel transport system substrate-binding protein